MIIAFYIVAGLAALVFLAAGLNKLFRDKPALQEAGMGYVEDFSPSAVKLIGLAEVLGAIGLIVPVVVGMAPILAPIAGICLAVLMIGAVAVHLRRKEAFAPALVLAVLAVAASVLGFIVVL